MKKGSLIVLSGFSGAGKGTIVKRLLEKHDTYALSISMTTRDPRPGEEEGKSYFFRSDEEFEKTIAEDGFLEYARYCDHYYGTPLAYVEECLQKGQDVILEITGNSSDFCYRSLSRCFKRASDRKRHRDRGRDQKASGKSCRGIQRCRKL